MKKTLIAFAALLALGNAPARARTHDAAFTYRMGAGFPGDVNRTHPASITPNLNDATNPVQFYGYPVVTVPANNSVRGFIIADQSSVTSIAGVAVRPYPTQQASGGMSSTLGVGVPPAGVIDILEDGFILVSCPDFAVNPPTKGGAVFVWTTATAGNKLQGSFVCAASAGNTSAISNAEFNGPPDSNGVCEIRVWKSKRT